MDRVAWKGIGVERAQTVQTTVVATGYHVQHKVCLHVEVARRKWMVVSPGSFLSSRRPRWNSTAGPVAEQREHARGHCVGVGGSVTHGNAGRFVAASLRGGRAVLPGYSVLGGLITFEIWTHLSLYFCVVSVRVWGLLKVGLCTDPSPRKRCKLARHLLNARTVQVWPHVSQNISGVCIAHVSRMQANPGTDFSGADYGAFVSFWGGSVLTGEEPRRHSGELNHALSPAGGPTQSQLSRPMSSGHHISMRDRQRRKHQKFNSDTDASK